MRTISLPLELAQYLRSAEFLDEDLVAIIVAQEGQGTSQGGTVLSLDGVVAERFREAFTERLAKAGFGVDYRPSAEGSILEDLIDKFAG